MIKDYFKISLKNVRRRKLRSWLTIVGIVISIATIFTLISLSLGLQDAIEEQFRQLGTDKFYIQPRGQFGPPGSTSIAQELTEEDVKVVEKVSGVVDLSYYTVGNAKVEFGEESRYVMTAGIPLDQSEVLIETGFYKPKEGRLLKEGDIGEVMIGSQYKDNNYFKKPVHAGDKLTINGQEFKVRGVLESIGNSQDDRLIYMGYEDFRPLFEIPERADFIFVQVAQEENIKSIADRTEKKLLSSRGLEEETRDFTILTPEELLESINQVLVIITGFLFGVGAISLLVGGIGIANTMFTSVVERTKEIGVMKAIGAQNKDILLLFTIESGFLGLVGGAIGVLFGIGIGKIIEIIAVEQLGTTILQVSTPLWLMGASLVFSFAIGSISGLWPAYRAANIKPVDALRYE